MSYLHMIIVQDDRIYMMNIHYRTAMKLLERGFNSVLPLLKHNFLDVGYIVVDMNRQVVVNGQVAFPIGKVVGKKDLSIIDA